MRVDVGLGGPEGARLFCEVQPGVLKMHAMVTSPTRRRALLPAAFLVVAAALASANAAQPVYFPDDPIAVDPETQDAGNVREWALSDPYDFVENTFFKPGDRTTAARAEHQHHR